MADDGLFTLRAPDGSTIARGSLSSLTERVLDSVARKDAEQLLRDAAMAVGQLESIQAGADAVAAREDAATARELALHTDAVKCNDEIRAAMGDTQTYLPVDCLHRGSGCPARQRRSLEHRCPRGTASFDLPVAIPGDGPCCRRAGIGLAIGAMRW